MTDAAPLVCSKHAVLINLLGQMPDFGDYAPELSEKETNPLFVRIARAIAADIRRGRLGSRARLPGSRELGKRLGAHRNTVLAAYAELEQEGWIVSQPARGTFVADVLPERKPRRFKAPEPPRLRSLELAELTLPTTTNFTGRAAPSSLLAARNWQPEPAEIRRAVRTLSAIVSDEPA